MADAAFWWQCASCLIQVLADVHPIQDVWSVAGDRIHLNKNGMRKYIFRLLSGSLTAVLLILAFCVSRSCLYSSEQYLTVLLHTHSQQSMYLQPPMSTVQCHHVLCTAAVSLCSSQLWPCQLVVADHLACVRLLYLWLGCLPPASSPDSVRVYLNLTDRSSARPGGSKLLQSISKMFHVGQQCQ